MYTTVEVHVGSRRCRRRQGPGRRSHSKPGENVGLKRERADHGLYYSKIPRSEKASQKYGGCKYEVTDLQRVI